MLPADGVAGSVTVIAADVVLMGYALPATAVKLPVCTDCHANDPPLLAERTPVTPVARGKLVAFVNVIAAGVPNAVTLPEGSIWGDLDAAIVINTFLVPAENVTADPELEELYTVVRVSVLADEYVPRPTSHSLVVCPWIE
jgi:hypothetical protein